MIALDAERTRNRPAGDVHHHRHSRAGLYRELLERIEQAVCAGGVKDAGAACRCAVADAGGAVLSFRGDQGNIVFSLRPHDVKIFCNLCGRGDRIVAHHMIVNLFRGVGGKLVAAVVHDFCSSIVTSMCR